MVFWLWECVGGRGDVRLAEYKLATAADRSRVSGKLKGNYVQQEKCV